MNVATIKAVYMGFIYGFLQQSTLHGLRIQGLRLNEG